ncbi:uncharacterized protein F4822DRAFT_321465 [Hypoxylon trugodes]|uniref:uncharacterized protein n=1 Tax=Hypoxylon trugodes TaxID=326681 RepID=UPI0021906587|nr:uncharacterized protein F4822DRAFT_321465 [Hypoxylon trugodes]KAI1386604.1 hypothetical protein F4822DRAFT_321465 [Hypoxylon trugodes]
MDNHSFNSLLSHSFNLDEDSHFLEAGIRGSLGSDPLISSIEVTSYIEDRSEPSDRTISLCSTKGDPSAYTINRKPLPSTASPPPTPPAQTDARASLLSPSSSKSKRQIISTRGNHWNWELGALVLSFSSLATLVGLLIYVDNRRLDGWNGTLNTVVSSLGAISRTSLGFAVSSCLGQIKWNWFKKRPDNIIAFDRFDDASRGPWGSLWLILWLRTCHWVTIGAIVTIILLGFEPFLQAVIHFTGQLDPSADSPRIQIGRSEKLDVGSYSSDGSTPVMGVRLTPSDMTIELEPYTFLPDLGIVSSFNNGFYNSSNNAKQTTSFVCPTANCTWPVFASLAVCSACNDVSHHLRRHEENGTNLGISYTSTSQMQGNYTIYSLPNLNLANIFNSTVTQRGNLYSLDTYMVATTITDPQLTLSFQNITTLITAVDILKADAGYEAGNLEWEDTPVSATECALYFCVNAYESTVQKGILTERIVASWAEKDLGSYRHTGGNNYSESSTHYDQYDKWINHSFYYYPGLDYPRSDLEIFIPAGDLKKYELTEGHFNLSQNTIGSTVRYVNEQLLNSTMAWPFPYNQKPVVQALYQSQNFTATFDRVAWTVSSWMRDMSNVTNPGVGHEWIIHIHVDWSYMILPLVTIVLGLIFSFWSILETRRLHLDPWKTGMIATLTLSVDAETRAQLRHAERNGYLDKAVKAMAVTFEDAGCGLELRTKHGG